MVSHIGTKPLLIRSHYARDMTAQLPANSCMYVNEFTPIMARLDGAAIRKFLTDARDNGYIDLPIEVESWNPARCPERHTRLLDLETAEAVFISARFVNTS